MKRHSKVPNFNLKVEDLCYFCGILIIETDDFWYCTQCQKYNLCNECRLCKSKHVMTKTKNLKLINSAYYNNTYGCDICGATTTATDIGIWHCTTCSYDVCPTCLPWFWNWFKLL